MFKNIKAKLSQLNVKDMDTAMTVTCGLMAIAQGVSDVRRGNKSGYIYVVTGLLGAMNPWWEPKLNALLYPVVDTEAEVALELPSIEEVSEAQLRVCQTHLQATDAALKSAQAALKQMKKGAGKNDAKAIAQQQELVDSLGVALGVAVEGALDAINSI